MPILTLQQRQRELGRIRLGQKVGAKGRPEKLDRFRFTSPSKAIIESIAAAYGGAVQPWNGAGTDQWEVVTEARRLPILVPPQPVSQWMELWSGGGCQRRCDGVTEVLSDQPCLCDPDPEKRDCKPTTRLNVVLRDVHGVGVFRLESHGFYSASELPQTAAFLASATGQGVYLPAHLALEERVVKRPGKRPNQFVVPIIEVDVTPAQLVAGNAGGVAIGDGSDVAIEQSQQKAIGAAPQRSEADWLVFVQDAGTVEELRGIWKDAAAAGLHSPAVQQAITAKIAKLQPAEPATTDPDVLWQQIVTRCPVDWTLDMLEEDFTVFTSGTAPGAADPEQLQAYLDKLTGVPA